TWPAGQPRAGGSPGAGRVPGDMVADDGAGPLPGAEESLAGQPVVGHGDGAARDAEAAGQLPGRRQPLAGRQAAVEDGAAQLPVDLPGQVVPPDQADVKLHQEIRPDRAGPVRTRRRPVAGHEDRTAAIVTAPVIDLLHGPPARQYRTGRLQLVVQL